MGTSFRRFAVAVAAGSLVAASLSGCGSRLSDDEVRAQNASSEVGLPAASGPVDSTGVPAVDTGPVAAAPNGLPTPKAAAGADATAPKPGASTAPGTAPGKAGSAPTQVVAGAPVNVGQIGLFSGLLGQILGTVKQGTQVSVAYLNSQGGLNGHRINLIQADDGGDPAAGLALAKKMIDEDKVIAFLNEFNPLTSNSVFPYISGRGVPMIGGIGVEPEYYTLPNAFPGAASPRVQSEVGTKYAVEQGTKKIAMVYCAEFNVLCSANAAAVKKDMAKLGGEVVFNQQVSLAQPDYTSQCLAAKQAGADGMLLIIDPNSVLRLTASCSAQDFHPKYFTLGIVFTSNLASSPDTDTMHGASADFPFAYDGPETAAFRKAYQDVIGQAPTTNLQASTWVGGLILQEAGKRLPVNPKPSDVIAGLHAIKANKLGGLVPAPLTYQAGKSTPSTLCAYIVQLKDKKFVAPNGLKPTCLDSRFADSAS